MLGHGAGIALDGAADGAAAAGHHRPINGALQPRHRLTLPSLPLYLLIDFSFFSFFLMFFGENEREKNGD